MAHTVREPELAKAADVLSAAFADYPIFRYVVPDGPARGRQLAQVFRFLIRLGLESGEVVASSDRIVCVAIWFRSARAESTVLAALRAGLLGLCLHAGFGVVSRLMRVSSTKRRARAGLLRDAYCLLDMIGVEPSLQGRGFARRLLEEKLRQLDEENLPCYLETSRAATVSYYERFGFELIHRYRFSNLDVFCLRREVVRYRRTRSGASAGGPGDRIGGKGPSM